MTRKKPNIRTLRNALVSTKAQRCLSDGSSTFLLSGGHFEAASFMKNLLFCIMSMVYVIFNKGFFVFITEDDETYLFYTSLNGDRYLMANKHCKITIEEVTKSRSISTESSIFMLTTWKLK